MNRSRLLTVVTLALLAAPVVADRGSIPFNPHAKIFEPNQRAMIAWNGTAEILVLTTDLHSSVPTKVLEVMPFPAEPEAAKGDAEVFRRATELINRKLRKRALTRGPKNGGADAELPAGEITFHEKIGAHDISVARARDEQGFITWVNDYLKRAGVGNPVIPPALRDVVKEYLAEGFAWFVFDVVSLDREPKTNEAIQYRFTTDRLFYPVRISRAATGRTEIDLLVLTPELLRGFPGIPSERIELRHAPVSITAEELKSLNPEMAALLGAHEDMKLRIWRLSGDLSEFDKDLIAR